MSRSHNLPVHEMQKLATRTVSRHRIWRWLDAIKGIFASSISDKLSSKVVFYLIIVLLLVISCSFISKIALRHYARTLTIS